MSAPLVVNTTDETVWTRRAVTRNGEPLYALAGVEDCPVMVMATLPELAEHGIAGTADVLPVPVGPEPQAPMSAHAASVRLAQYGERTKTWSTATYDSGTEKALHEIAMTLQARVDEVERKYTFDTAELKRQLESARVDGRRLIRAEQRRAELEAVLATHRKDDQAEIERLRAERAEVGNEIARFGIYGAALPAAKALVKRADELVTENAELRARVAELEAERHTTNEALDDAVQALRERQAEREALVERLRAGQTWQRGRSPELVSENLVSQSELREIFGIPLVAPWGDGITQLVAPTQALREDEPLIVDVDGAEPTPLRWGLNDVMWGDDDSVVVMLSGPDREPYWLELDAGRAAVLRQDLAGSEGAEASPEERLLDGDELKRAVRGHLFGGGQ